MNIYTPAVDGRVRPVMAFIFAHPAPAVQAAQHVLELYFVFGTLGTPDIADMMKVPADEGERCLGQLCPHG